MTDVDVLTVQTLCRNNMKLLYNTMILIVLYNTYYIIKRYNTFWGPLDTNFNVIFRIQIQQYNFLNVDNTNKGSRIFMQSFKIKELLQKYMKT